MKRNANKPKEYKALAIYLQLTGAMRYYVERQQQQAFEENAPLNAMYKRGDEWRTLDDFADSPLKMQIVAILNAME